MKISRQTLSLPDPPTYREQKSATPFRQLCDAVTNISAHMTLVTHYDNHWMTAVHFICDATATFKNTGPWRYSCTAGAVT